MQNQTHRNIFTQDSFRNNPDKLDRLVFIFTLACGVISLFLPWGGSV
ncbi:MAG: hypothetical protein ACYCZR_02095 [Burkholderiales bacterium]|jgi:hypothetical protein|nr:hypothetical protein [Sulfuricella sp.]